MNKKLSLYSLVGIIERLESIPFNLLHTDDTIELFLNIEEINTLRFFHSDLCKLHNGISSPILILCVVQ